MSFSSPPITDSNASSGLLDPVWRIPVTPHLPDEEGGPIYKRILEINDGINTAIPNNSSSYYASSRLPTPTPSLKSSATPSNSFVTTTTATDDPFSFLITSGSSDSSGGNSLQSSPSHPHHPTRNTFYRLEGVGSSSSSSYSPVKTVDCPPPGSPAPHPSGIPPSSSVRLSQSPSKERGLVLPASSETPASCQWGIIALGFVNTLIDSALGSAIVPILPRLLGLDELHEGIVLSVSAVTGGIAGPIFGWFSDAYGWTWALVWFYPMFIGSTLLMMLGNRSFGTFVLARLVAGVGTGFMFPSTFSMVTSTHPPDCKSTALGFVLAGDVGSLAGPLLGGYLYDLGGTALVFSLLCAAGVCAFVLFLIVALRSAVWGGARSRRGGSYDDDEFDAYTTDAAKFNTLEAPLLGPSRSTSAFQSSVYSLLPSAAATSRSQARRASVPGGGVAFSGEGRLGAAGVGARIKAGGGAFRRTAEESRSLMTRRRSACCCSLGSRVPARTVIPFPCFPMVQDAAYVDLSSLSARSIVNEHEKIKKAPSVNGDRVCPCCSATFGTMTLTPDPFLASSPADINRKGRVSSSFTRFLSLNYLKESTSEIFGVFMDKRFISLCAVLFYIWGVGVTISAVLPIRWNSKWGLSPSKIGLLLLPHVILRVASLVLLPLLSSSLAVPLPTLIFAGVVLTALPMMVLGFVSEKATPVWQAVCAAVIGIGIGTADTTTFSWAGIVDFSRKGLYEPERTPRARLLSSSEAGGGSGAQTPTTVVSSTDPTPQQASSVNNGDEGEEFRGRAFALLAASCEIGILVVPFLASIVTEYLSFQIAFVTFGALGIALVILLPYTQLAQS